MKSEYPEVDGKMSQLCYLKALDDCYTRMMQKMENEDINKTNNKKKADNENDKTAVKSSTRQNKNQAKFSFDHFDYFCFHSPYTKLVQKAFGRLLLHDYLTGKCDSDKTINSSLAKWQCTSIDDTLNDRELDSVLKELSLESFETKVAPSCVLSRQIGNTYTASVYMNLVCLISSLQLGDLLDKNILLYSYGSGSLASMLQINVREPTSEKNLEQNFTIDAIADIVDLRSRLTSRESVSPEELEESIRIREKHLSKSGYTPQYSISSLFPNTYYLEEVGFDYTRLYSKKPHNAPRMKGLFYPVHGTNVLCIDSVRSNGSQNGFQPVYVNSPHPSLGDELGSIFAGSGLVDKVAIKRLSIRFGIRYFLQ